MNLFASDTLFANRGGADGASLERMQRLRLRLYALSLLVAFFFYLLIDSAGRSSAFWIVSALIVAGVSMGALGAANGPSSSALRMSALAAAFLSALVPLAPDMLRAGLSFPQAVSRDFIWPQILVALFSSRVLAEENAFRFTEFSRSPLARSGSIQFQSTPAAFAMGLSLLLAFYAVTPSLQSATNDPALKVIGASIMGSTLIHVGIIFLFFVALAHIGEATLYQLGERATLRQAQALIASGSAEGVAEILRTVAREAAHSRGARLMRAAAAGEWSSGLAGNSLEAASFADFQNASRRFVRNLIAILPMLGFLGTVVGLSTTLSELPSAIGTGASSQALDFSGALGGLAIKFQTTLLGLLASMVCGVALALLERSELEFEAECLLVVSAGLADESAAPAGEQTSLALRRTS